MVAHKAEESHSCRHTAVKSEGRVLLHLKDGPEEPRVVSVPKHKKHPPAGVKATTRTRVSVPARASWRRPMLSSITDMILAHQGWTILQQLAAGSASCRRFCSCSLDPACF